MTNTALITGGTKGFGRALAEALVADGWRVVVDGRDEEVAAAIGRRLGPQATVVVGDVADAAHRRELVRTVEAHGRLDLLVNNASTLGASPQPHLRDLAPAVLEHVLGVNVVAPVALTAALLPLLRPSAGAIVNVTSDAAVEAYAGWGAYGASKAALEQVSAVLAVEEPDVAVWWFDPGDMRTEMHQAAFPGEDISDRADPASVVPALRRLLTDRPPSGRVRAADLLAGAGR